MPAVTTDNILVLPRIARPDPAATTFRPVTQVVTAPTQMEGAGFEVRRPFPNATVRSADPFLLLDHLGAVEYAPGEAKGAPWHPHRGFETVTYILDGAVEHHDSTGGGGLITNGATQWMTAGGGILHIERPPEALIASGGLFHRIPPLVNPPPEQKRTPPPDHDNRAARVTPPAPHAGGAAPR